MMCAPELRKNATRYTIGTNTSVLDLFRTDNFEDVKKYFKDNFSTDSSMIFTKNLGERTDNHFHLNTDEICCYKTVTHYYNY